MATLGFVLAAFLDPIQAGIVLAVVLVYRGALPVIVAGALRRRRLGDGDGVRRRQLRVGRARRAAHDLLADAGCHSLVGGTLGSLGPQWRQPCAGAGGRRCG